MKSSKSVLALAMAFTCTAFTYGTGFRAQAQTVKLLYEFSGTQGGAVAVIQGPDGNLYGTSYAGDFSHGSVFRLTPGGDFTTIYSFCSQTGCPDGSELGSGPILGSNGNLFGVTEAGGNSTGAGTFFTMTLEGNLTTLYRFCPDSQCEDGRFPTGIILASDGNFYGTAEIGGQTGTGTLFSISPNGTFQLLHTFCSQPGCTDGASPTFPPIQGIDGNFYGTARLGGTRGGGVLYQFTASGVYKVLYNFCSSAKGPCPEGENPTTIVEDGRGNFFGTTSSGGNANNYGTVFELTRTHQYRVLHTFLGDDGDFPNQGLTLASDGSLYGQTQGGGGPRDGNLFKVTPADGFKSFYVFRYGGDGYSPFYGPLFQGTDGNLYGTTLYGPLPCCYGTIFRVSGGLPPLVETVPLAGQVGAQVLILGNGLTGSTGVNFHGESAAFSIVSDTEILATVPPGATTGKVSVVTPSATLTSNPEFVVTNP